jgi:hypothetical protein
MKENLAGGKDFLILGALFFGLREEPEIHSRNERRSWRMEK